MVGVRCHLANGTATDSRFTILVSGGRAYDLTTPFAFAQRLLSAPPNLIQDTSQTSFNSVTGHIGLGQAGTGVYNFVFAGLEHPAMPVSLQATGVVGVERCRVQNYDLNNAVLQAGCNAVGGAPTNAGASVMWFTRGRVGHRYGFASTNNVGAAAPPVDAQFTSSSSGAAVTSRRLSTGTWTVTFAGLARPTGAKEIVVVSALKDPDHTCTLVSWASAGADLTVTVQCFDASGAPFDGRFSVLVVE
jgi:hypothetical protein